MSTEPACALSGLPLPWGTPVTVFVLTHAPSWKDWVTYPSDSGRPATGAIRAVMGHDGPEHPAVGVSTFWPLAWHGIKTDDPAKVLDRVFAGEVIESTDLHGKPARTGLFVARSDVYDALMDDDRIVGNDLRGELRTRAAYRAGADRYVDILLSFVEIARTGVWPEGEGAGRWKRQAEKTPALSLVYALSLLDGIAHDECMRNLFLGYARVYGEGDVGMCYKAILTGIQDRLIDIDLVDGTVPEGIPDEATVALWRQAAREAAEVMRAEDMLLGIGRTWSGEPIPENDYDPEEPKEAYREVLARFGVEVPAPAPRP